MADYGITAVGASGWWVCEVRYCTYRITLPGSELVTSSSAYLRSQGSATNGLKMALYNASDETLAYESDVLAGFTDTTGGWKTFTWTGVTPAAGSYRLAVIGDAIAGGANTVELAYDTVGADATVYQEYFFGGTWPTLDADLTGGEVPTTTRQGSIYLTTGSSSGNIAWIRA